MYTLIDRPVERLGNGARFVLWAMRGWTQAMHKQICPSQALHRGFAGVSAQVALPDFHVAMALLNRYGRAAIEIAPLPCQRIIDHEAVLLVLWRDLAQARLDHADATLALLVEDGGVSPVRRAMTTTLAKLALAGFDLTHIELQTIEE
jgi:hypothetical protein